MRRQTAQIARTIFVVKDTSMMWITSAASRSIRGLSCLLLTILTLSAVASAASAGELEGTVVDPMGAAVVRANVQLIRGNISIATTVTNDSGKFRFVSLRPGRYRVRAVAPGFTEQGGNPVYVSNAKVSRITLSLKIGPLLQQIVVLATGTPALESQVGASISSVNQPQMANEQDVSQALRSIPGFQVLQTGQRGGTTDIFVRGGNANTTKVLIDGIPINDIGGQIEFANLATSGIDQVEVLRGPNSVLFGADALAGVIDLKTSQGTTPLPQLVYSVDAGNFNTRRQEISLGGARGQFDYFSDFSRFDTANSVPNSAFHNATYAGNFGWSPSSSTLLRFTLRHTGTVLGLPNALDIYGIPDNSLQNEQDSYFGATVQNQTTSRWHNLLQYGGTRLRFHFENPTPTGQPFDPFGTGANYLGNQVTLRGANGFQSSGRGILDFGGDYPQLFDTRSTRDFAYAQSDYRFSSHLSGLLAFRYENEQGFTRFSGTKTPTDRNNLDYTAQISTDLWRRLYATAGVGVEKNAVFGVVATPRISLAYYVARLRTVGALDGTKLRFNYGKGIKEPAIFDESTSLFALLSQLPNGAQLISQFHVQPIGAERSRSFDFGVDQTMWSGRAKLGVTFFHNDFFDQVEFVDSSALPQLGVPKTIALATPFGASVNSGASRAMGAELAATTKLGRSITVSATYTYLDDVVRRSFASSALAPAFNPAFPTVPIGNSPLVGNPPFRRARHSGSFLIGYSRGRWVASLTGNLVGRRDDSTHAVDAFFGPSLQLPNRNLDDAYQNINLHGSCRLNSAVELYTNLDNILAQHYDAAFGFPSLPFTFRSGLKLTLGGESWKKH